ncbi:hypothetical protein Rhopal_000782-T1 [Rhodotorula paludigena]|uniref:DnaJ homolog 1, mitochondrial n=1 Tax=Rhodotorula paludigena TaxID=86838 RepID=A0AAV5GER0_9BASI|nr:hypothetical protein Rhopal_000782-T1 [Rhodotorula paludigena]
MARPPALLHLAHQPARAAAAAPAVPLARIPSPSSSRSFSAAATAPRTARQGQRVRTARTWLGNWLSGAPAPAQRAVPTAARAFHASARRALNKNPYAALGVSKDASSSEIKKAYYGLAKKYHPDSSKEKDAKERFVEVQEAYDILSDDKKRADFDRFGSASTQPGFDSDAYARATSSFGGAGFGDFFGGGAGGPGGADIFESLFGAFGRGGSAGPRQTVPVGDDIDVSISVPFIDAAKGASRTIAVSPVVDCHTCHGSGMKEGMKKTTCASCGGSGTRTFTIQSGFQMASTCASCGGSGSVAPPGSNCGTCAGVGKVRERRTVEVKIPPGVDDGMKIRLDGKGDAPLGGKGRNGDLFVRINVQPSKVFTRQGSNLYQNVSVPFYTAILGGRAPVKTLDRDVEVRVPQGTQPGEEMVMRGRGVKKLYKDEFGDLVVRFNVTMPRSLTPAQRRILEQFVAETEIPGSTSHYPSPSATSSDTPATRSPPPTPEADEPAPGPQRPDPTASPAFTQQAKPPPADGESAAKPQWWSTMSDDITSTAGARAAAEAAEAAKETARETKESVEDKLEHAREVFDEVSEEVRAKAEGVKEQAEEKKDEAHSLLGDLWKAGKKKVKSAAGCEKDAKDGDKKGGKKDKQ